MRRNIIRKKGAAPGSEAGRGLLADRRRRIWLAAVVPAFIAVSVVLGMLVAIQRSGTVARARAVEVVSNSAREQADTVESVLNGQFAILEVFAASVAIQESIDVENIIDRMNAIESSSDFTGLFFAIGDGRAYTTMSPDVFDISDRPYFTSVMAGESTVAEIDENMEDGESLIIIAVPVKRGDEVLAVLGGGFDEPHMREMLVPEVYSGAGYAYIVNENGDIIVGSDKSDMLAEKNIFEVLDAAKYLDGGSAGAVRGALAARENAAFSYKFGRYGRTVAFIPIDKNCAGGEKWFLANVIPDSVIDAEAGAAVDDSALGIAIVVVFTLGGFIFYAVREWRADARLAEEANDLRIVKEQYRITAQQSGRTVYMFDIRTHTATKDDGEPGAPDAGNVMTDVPESLIASGAVDDESIAELRDFFRMVIAGESSVTADIRMNRNGESAWFRYCATAIPDPSGRPHYAVISYYDVTEQLEHEMAYNHWRMQLGQLPEERFKAYEANLTSGVLEKRRGMLFPDFKGMDTENFADAVRALAERAVFSDDAPGLIKCLTRDRLIAAYMDGANSDEYEFRLFQQDGSLRWTRVSVEMLEHSGSGHIMLYAQFSDIDEEKRRELALIERSETDALTGTLNRAAFEGRVENTLSEAEADFGHAFMMLDIDGFKGINDSFGHGEGDRLLIEMSEGIASLLRQSDMLGRMGGDEFMVFLKDIPSRAAVEKKAAQICAIMRKRLGDAASVSVSIGISMFPGDGDSFDELYKKADSALYFAKSSGKDRYCFFNRDMKGSTAHDGDEAYGAAKARPYRRMLVVDDSPIDREIYAEMFKDDFIVLKAHSGVTALSMMRRYGRNISVVLLDLTMPQMNGFEVMERMRADKTIAGIPVIVISSSDDAGVGVRAIEAGAGDFLHKPADERLLKLRVHNAVGRAENERQRVRYSYLALQGEKEELYRQVLLTTGTVVFTYDPAGDEFTYSANAREHLWGKYNARPLWDILAEDGVAGENAIACIRRELDALASAREPGNKAVEVELKTARGEEHVFRIQFIRISEAVGLTRKLIMVFNDINDEVEKTKSLHFMAEYDALTGLLNKNGFELKVAETLSSAKEGAEFGILAFDIKDFSVYNTVRGKEAGDELLRLVAALAMSLRGEDEHCARYDADNFAVFSSNLDYEGNLKRIRSMDEAFREALGNSAALISYGMYEITDRTLPVSGMYDRARAAKATVKGNYEQNVAVFDETMFLRRMEDAALIEEQESALKNGEFVLYYQPKYNAVTERITGAEALVRWRRGDGQMIPPGRFITLFEKNGRIARLDIYVFNCVCRLLKSLIDKGMDPAPISVNFSRAHLYDTGLAERLGAIAAHWGVPLGKLEIEVTESAFISDIGTVNNTLEGLRCMGFTVSMDDFGCGYSSLNSLKDAAVDTLKVDMHFLSGFERGGNVGTVVTSVVRMAKWLGMNVVAEGVETREQLDFLKSIGTDTIQGYYFSRPVPEEEFIALLGSGEPHDGAQATGAPHPEDIGILLGGSRMVSNIIASMCDGFGLYEYCDGRLELIRANDAYLRLTGAMTGIEADAFMAIAKEDREAARSAVKTAAETMTSVRLTVHRRHMDGRMMALESVVSCVGVSSSRPIISIVFSDVTARDTAAAQWDTRRVAVYAVAGGRLDAPIFAGSAYRELFGGAGEQAWQQAPMHAMINTDEDGAGHESESLYEAIAAASRSNETLSGRCRVRGRDGALRTARFALSAADAAHPGEQALVIVLEGGGAA